MLPYLHASVIRNGATSANPAHTTRFTRHRIAAAATATHHHHHPRPPSELGRRRQQQTKQTNKQIAQCESGQIDITVQYHLHQAFCNYTTTATVTVTVILRTRRTTNSQQQKET